MVLKATIWLTNFSDSDTMALPILLTLCHPFSFYNLFVALKHVKDFRSFLGSLPAGSENSQAAQNVLVDAVDCSGIDLRSLISLLEEHYLDSIQKIDRMYFKRYPDSKHSLSSYIS